MARKKPTAAPDPSPKLPASIDWKKLRDHYDLDQREFAVRFGVPLGTLRNWEQGRRKPSVFVIKQLMAAFPEYFAKS